MISAALSLALVVGTVISPDATVEPQATTINQAIDLRIDVYSFNAVNTTTKDHLLVFGYGSAQFIRALPQGESISWPLPLRGTEGVTLEILTPSVEGWTTSTPVSIDIKALTGGAPIMMSANNHGLTAWKQTPASKSARPINASASRSDAATRSTPSYSSTSSATSEQVIFHVPSVTGLDNPGPQKPPVLDDDPLPAI